MKKRSSPQSANASEQADNAEGRPFTATIEAMGGQGHGVARIGGARVHIPYTLPGETVRAELRGTKAELIGIESASPDRIEPICRHFGMCGGCSLQNWREAPYAAWKAGLVE